MRRTPRLSGLGVCLAVVGTSVTVAGLAIHTLPAAAVSACSAPGSPGQGAASKSIDTDQGCDNPNGQATDPASGWIAIGLPAGSSSALADDAFQALPAAPPQRFFQGKYTLAFDSCSGGNAGASPADVGAGGTAGSGTTGGTAVYTVTGDGDYPKTPPPSTPQQPIAVSASAPGGAVICHYSLQVVGSPPSGQVASFKNDLFIAFDNGQSTQTATESVKPFAESTGTKSTTTTSTTTSTSEKTTEQSNQSTSTSGASGAVLGLSTSSSGSAAGVAGAVAGVQAVQTPNTGAQPAVLGGLLLTGLGLLLIGASQRRRRGPG